MQFWALNKNMWTVTFVHPTFKLFIDVCAALALVLYFFSHL